MTDLATAYREALQSSLGDAPAPAPAEADAADLDARLRALCARGRAAFPAVHITDETFTRFLGGVMARADAKADAPRLQERVIEDLYLACACAAGADGAVAAFDQRCGSAVRIAVSRLAPSPAAQDEILQALRDTLLVGRPDAPAKIGRYAGTGPLARWVAVTAQRQALMTMRSDRAEARARHTAVADTAPPADPELAYLKARYRDEFERALATLIDELDDRERVLLRLNLVQGASAERIGKMYGVSRSTAQRWIEDVREKIRDGMERSMRDRIALTSSGVGAVAGLVASQLNVSLSRLLRPK